MVGHTGVIPAAVKAIEAVDECLGRVVATVLASGGACLITADHGNADHMLEPDGSPNTAHSLNPVPLILTIPGPALADGGILADGECDATYKTLAGAMLRMASEAEAAIDSQSMFA